MIDVRPFLASKYGEVTDVELLGQGEWSVAFGFRTGGDDLVIRVGGHVEDFERDREAMAYAAPDLPVPAILEIGACPGLGGGFFAVSERAYGTAIDLMDEAQLRLVVPPLLRALDVLRAAPEQPARWHEHLLTAGVDDGNERMGGWRPRLATRPEVGARFDEARARLPDLVARCPADAGHVVHGDTFNRNVLADPCSGRITAVLDWGCSVRGDFLFDLAWLTFWEPWHPPLEALDVRSMALAHYAEIGLDVPDFDDRMRCYEVHIGLAGMAYQALTERWDDLERTSHRTLDVLA